MEFDFSSYFDRYLALSKAADAVFDQVKESHPECVNCRVECSDCCHAIFDLTLIEALYLNHRFEERFSGKEREDLLTRANTADRRIAKLKRKAFQSLQAGEEESDILEKLGSERVGCPLLNEKSLCDLYDHRPITCRLYGIPASIGGKGRTCALSGFEAGKAYPTVNIDVIITRLQELSAEVIRDMKAKHIKLADLLMPVSMALLTEFDDAYFGFDDNGAEGA
jgi:Fe-S-cluster containining protein